MTQRPDPDIEQLIEEITRGVMRALETDQLSNPAARDRCDYCGDGLCVQRCPSEIQRVVEAGAERLAACPGANCVPEDIAKLIDHTLLKPEAKREEVEKLCQEAKQYGFAAVVINPAWVPLAARLLRGTPVKVCAVVGFPLGASNTQSKIFETRKAIREGAQEIDMVINIGALKSKDYSYVEDDIRVVCRTAHENGALCKVIIEAALLSDEEKIIACSLAKSAGADYVKTSTGFGPGGATEYDVALMRAVVGSDIGVKAAGGIRSFEQALALVKAGATRIGASAGVKILQEARAWKGGRRVGLERPAAPSGRAGPRRSSGPRSY